MGPSPGCRDVLPVGLMKACTGCGGVGCISLAEVPAVGSWGCHASGTSSASCPVSIARALGSHRGVRSEESPCPHLKSLWSAVGQVPPSCRISDVRFGWRCDGWHVAVPPLGSRQEQAGPRCCCLRRRHVPHHAESPSPCTDVLRVL